MGFVHIVSPLHGSFRMFMVMYFLLEVIEVTFLVL